MKNQNNKNLRIVIKTSYIAMILFLLLLIIPDDFFNVGTLYISSTPSFIRSNRLDFHLGIIHVFILLLGFWDFFRINKIKILIIPFFMLIRELCIVLVGVNTIFSASAYEMYLVIFISYGLLVCIERRLKNFQQYDNFLRIYLIINVLSIYLNFFIQGANLSGRYNASNLDVGGTGTICALCILYLGFLIEKNWKDYLWIGMAVGGLFLSGSRANLVFLICIVMISILKTFYEDLFVYKSISRLVLQKIFICGMILMFTICFFYILFENKLGSYIFNFRLFENMSLEQVVKDESILGRKSSLKAGWEVIKSYPFGISGYFINLQYEIQSRGYPTFPHSYIMSAYILYGPIVLGVYVIWGRIIKNHKYLPNQYLWLIVYFSISTIFYGGPITNFKVMFNYLFVTFGAMKCIELKKNEST